MYGLLGINLPRKAVILIAFHDHAEFCLGMKTGGFPKLSSFLNKMVVDKLCNIIVRFEIHVKVNGS